MLSFRTVQELIRLQQAVKEDIAAFHLATRVNVLDPDHTYIDPRVTIGAGTTILPGTILRGETVIGENCEIGPNAMLIDCQVGDGCVINASQCYESTMGQGVHVGPYAHIRPHCQVGDGCKVGAFVEIKNAVLGAGTKLSHLTYVGDADVGERNTNLVPPVTVGSGAYIADGTTVTKDVEPDSLAIGRVRQENKAGWAKTRRNMHKK